MKFVIFLLQFVLFIVLTIVTQIGGIVYLLSLFLSKKWKPNFRYKGLVTFLALYLFSTILIVPLLAPIFGREKVMHSDKIKPANYMTVLLNRNYVQPALNDLLQETEKKLEGTNIWIHYLDANFPFISNFPLLPHLSHSDGKKIDLSLIYETQEGEITTKQKSMSGYGSFEGPRNGEYDQTQECLKSGYFQYGYSKYLSLGTINNDLIFSEIGTKKLIQSLLKNPLLGKIFIEPHLKQRLSLTNPRIRFHGCQAVRHDDHIHVQLK